MVASGRTAQQSARWPPGPAKVDAKKLDLMSIRTFEDLHDRYGDIFILPLGETPLVVTRHPEHIRQLLVEMGDTHQFPRPPNVIANVKTLFGEALIATDGKLHKERRQHLNPHFFEPEKLRISWENSRPFIERYVSSMHDLSASDPAGADAYFLAELLSFDLTGRLILGLPQGFHAQTNRQYPAKLKALKIADSIFLSRAMNNRWRETETQRDAMTFELCGSILYGAFRRSLQEAKTILDNQDRCPHLRDDAAAYMVHENKLSDFGKESQMMGMMAGVGNTARGFTDCVCLLAEHPKYQSEILHELHRVIGGVSNLEASEKATKGLRVDWTKPTYAQLGHLELVQNFVSESLRVLSPSTSTAPRYVAKDTLLGDYVIPAETKILINIWGAHYHPAYWTNPQTFDPHRFDDTPVGYAWLPFGSGGHRCLGQRTAQDNMIYAVAYLVANYALVLKSVPSGKKLGSRWASKASKLAWNTTLSQQLLGFTEPLDPVMVSLTPRQSASTSHQSRL
eukprot:GEMP01011362.1.p1 GENE.GEMP01011362.1~~GEMP01011362.1.p1  ORF type:complete len:510 (+),score=111.25 GEMP01011362.1:81-1610(+)